MLKQLVAYVGREPFRDGLRAYFAKHAWGNTTLDDLLSELEATSGRDLRTWSKLWLETAGVSTLRPVLEVDDRGRIAVAAIEQTCAPGFETLRPHTLAIGLYAVRDGVLERTDRLELDVDGERTEVPELVGREQPDLLLVNDDDLAYAKIRLDERSLATALSHPRGFTSSLPRSLVLASLWDMTRDAEMGARHFVDVVLETLPGESDSTLLRTLVAQLQTAVHSYSAPEHRDALRASTRDRLWEVARSAEPGSDAQLQLVSAAAALTAAGDDTHAAAGPARGHRGARRAHRRLRDALDAAHRPRRRRRGRRRRRSTPSSPARTPPPRASGPPGRGPRGRPREAKEQAWAEAVDGGRLPTAVVEAAALGFTRPGTSPDLLRPFVERYHAMLDTVHERGSHALIESIVYGFYPRPLADAALCDRTQAWLDANPGAPAALRRLVVENRDPVVRALAAQERDARG